MALFMGGVCVLSGVVVLEGCKDKYRVMRGLVRVLSRIPVGVAKAGERQLLLLSLL